MPRTFAVLVSIFLFTPSAKANPIRPYSEQTIAKEISEKDSPKPILSLDAPRADLILPDLQMPSDLSDVEADDTFVVE